MSFDSPTEELGMELDVNISDLEKILHNHTHWEESSKTHGENHSTSWKDHNMIALEIRNLLKYIDDGDIVLDAGCSNGFTSFEMIRKKQISIHGIDYSKTSIEHAQRRKEREFKDSALTFSHGNLLNLNFDDETFDKVVTVRVVINQPNYELQKKAILEVWRVLKPGGTFLMSEAFAGSLRKLNALRNLANLPAIESPSFNLYLEEDLIETDFKQHFEIQKICRFSSIYYVASRFLRYLTLEKGEEQPYDNPINNFFRDFEETSASGDFGVQKLYVLKKK